MTSKIGPHVIIGPRNGFGPFLETTKGKLAIVKTVDDHGAATEAKALDPNVLTVGRVNEARHYETGQMVDMQAWEPRGPYKERTGAVLAAYDYYQTVKPYWNRNPQIDVWETFNEFSNHERWQGWFFIALMDLAEEDGYTLALYSSSTGRPPDLFVANEMVESLREAKRRGHYLSLHSYGGVGTDIKTLKGTEPFHALRYRQTYNNVLIPANANPPLILSEIGQAGGFDYLGWDTLGPDLEWYDNELAKDKYVVGATLFTLGKWYQSNYQDALPQLAEHIVNFVPDTTPPVDPPDPDPLECAPRLRYKRVYHYIEHTDERPALFADRLAVWMEADKTHGTYGNSLDDALHGPGVDAFCILYGIERDRQMEFKAFRIQYYPDARPLEFKPIPDGETEPPQPEQLQIVWPTDADPHFITWSFGDKGEGVFHFGLDSRCARGTTVRAVADGVVSFIGVDPHSSGGFGLYIRMETTADKQYKIYHAHLLEATVQVGATLRQGDAIALSDDTGNSSGDHHHLEIREKRGENWVPVDPMDYMIESEKPDEPPTPEPETHVPQAWLHLNASGLHPNDGQPFLDDIDMLKDARMDGFLFTTNSDIDPDSLGIMSRQTGIPPENIIIRIHKSGSDPDIANPAKYVEHARPWVIHGLERGVRKFQLWNEPNLDRSMVDAGKITLDQMEWPHDAVKFAEVYLETVFLFRAEFGNDMQIALPPMSPQDNAAVYLNILSMTDADERADWASVHSYFSTDGSGQFGIDSLDGGLYWQFVLELIRPDLPVWLTEFADNGDGSDADRARRTAEYFTKQYPTRIKGVACYISQDVNFPKQAWNKNPHMIERVANR